MNCRRLIRASQLFLAEEGRGRLYDYYMSEKDWSVWKDSPLLPNHEIMLLFWFILSWDRNFRGDIDLFRDAYHKVYPIVQRLRGLNLVHVDLRDQILGDLSQVFGAIAKCTPGNRRESTDASKIIHTMLPDLAVMWDTKIRRNVLGSESRKGGHDYAFTFMPKMKEEANEALDSYCDEHHCSREEAVLSISAVCQGHRITKLLDEHNYVVYTMGLSLDEAG